MTSTTGRLRAGHSMVEMCLVLFLLALIAVVCLAHWVQVAEQARRDTAAADLAHIRDAVDRHLLTPGRGTPDRIDDLRLAPERKMDPWGQPYEIHRPSSAPPRIVSGGPDRTIETTPGEPGVVGDDMALELRRAPPRIALPPRRQPRAIDRIDPRYARVDELFPVPPEDPSCPDMPAPDPSFTPRGRAPFVPTPRPSAVELLVDLPDRPGHVPPPKNPLAPPVIAQPPPTGTPPAHTHPPPPLRTTDAYCLSCHVRAPGPPDNRIVTDHHHDEGCCPGNTPARLPIVPQPVAQPPIFRRSPTALAVRFTK